MKEPVLRTFWLEHHLKLHKKALEMNMRRMLQSSRRPSTYLPIRHLSLLNVQIAPHPHMKKGPNLNFSVQIPNKGKRVLQKYLLERKEHRKHLKRCLENVVAYPGPPQIENEIDMFFKAMTATVKQFRPNLATRTKASVFKVVTDMELLNQQSLIPRDIGFTNIHDENQSMPQFSSTSSPSSTPHSSHTHDSFLYSCFGFNNFFFGLNNCKWQQK
ncbi:unnamed protein product [Hermetia illucens]|uniref:Uncharacterized protein n=1 Tax=Hermetia illucens TaxID=343691 RepID=A0A7R8UQU8_HERIL|nr:unnamed protein product [Hermetia illucens]